jgi:hypothetical protein
MKKRERPTVVSDVTVELFRWIRDGRSPDEDPLPSLRSLARRFGVSLGSIREAVQRLEALELLHTSPKRRPIPRSPDLVFKVDILPLWFRGASSRQHVESAVHTFCELKWLLAQEVLIEMIRVGPQDGIGEVVDAYTNLIVEAHPNASRLELVNWEVVAAWRAAYILERPGLLALANSLAGSIEELSPVWDRIVVPSECRERALLLSEAVEKRNADLRPENFRKMKEVEWTAWKKRLELLEAPGQPARVSGNDLLALLDLDDADVEESDDPDQFCASDA